MARWIRESTAGQYDRYGLSHSTVKHHLANARSKVGAETTAQLVRILSAHLPEPEGRPAHPSPPTCLNELVLGRAAEVPTGSLPLVRNG